jgi:uncharacterized membrane protein YciS (DUF1049 family)
VNLLLADLGLRTAVKYVAAAYAVVWLVTILWVSIVQSKQRRMERQIEAAERELAERRQTAAASPDRVAIGS